MELPRRLSICSVLLAVLLASACNYDESYFDRRVQELNQMAGQAKGEPAKRIRAMVTGLRKKLAALPAGKGRQRALNELCREARRSVKDAERLLAGEEVERAAATGDKAAPAEDPKEMEAYQKRFVGRWEGPGTKLVISDDGRASYQRKAGGMSKRVNAIILEFHKDRFKVGLMGLGTTIHIDRAPWREGGQQKVKVDGVVLTRTDRPSFGSWVCTRLDSGRCADAAESFDAKTLQTLHMVHVSPQLPPAGGAVQVVWIAQDVGQAAPPETVIGKTPLTLDEAQRAKATHFTVHGELSRPTKGWPPGRYRVEVRSGDKVLSKVTFRITAGAATEVQGQPSPAK